MSIVPKYFEVNENGFLTTSPDGLEKFVQERINATLQEIIDQKPKDLKPSDANFRTKMVNNGKDEDGIPIKVPQTFKRLRPFNDGFNAAIAAYTKLIESKMK